MKRIYTYGHEQVQRNKTIGDIIENKKNGIKMTQVTAQNKEEAEILSCLLYTSPSPRDRQKSRMPSSA